MNARTLLVLLALLAVASATYRYRDSSNDVVPGVNPNAPGRRIPMERVLTQTPRGPRYSRHSACRSLEKLSAEDVTVCKNMLLRDYKNARVQKKLSQMRESAPTPAPTHKPQSSGYLVNLQWDGRTVPDVEWALKVTRQRTVITYPFEPEELQYQTIIPTRTGPAQSPSFSAYDSLSRNYFAVTNVDDYGALVYGLTISGDTNSSTYAFPSINFNYTNPGSNMVGLETVYLGSQQILLVFFDDGSVEQVDPTTGAGTPYTTLVDATRQIMCTEYRKNSREIFVFSMSLTERVTNYAIHVFNYATRQVTSTVMMQNPSLFQPTEEVPFEMLWVESVQNLIMFWTGPFDHLMYLNPVTGNTSYAVYNLAQFQGAEDGNLEFTVSNFLEDLDTDANSAIDVVGGWFYFQCSDVDPQTGFATTTLCGHQIPTDLSIFSYVQVMIEPMTYGYCASEFVQIE